MADDVPYTVPRAAHDTLAVPVDFWLNGWQHALTGSEILAYLAIHELRRLEPTGHETTGVRLPGDTRIRSYGLSKDTYENFRFLCEYGLLEAEADFNRRDDGTFEGFSTGTRPMPNRYRLIEGATARPAAQTILAAILHD
jgi:hypothetical protein